MEVNSPKKTLIMVLIKIITNIKNLIQLLNDDVQFVKSADHFHEKPPLLRSILLHFYFSGWTVQHQFKSG